MSLTLTKDNSLEILGKYVELAQKNGAYLLSESGLLKRCRDVLLGKSTDPEINVVSARGLFIQAIHKGQSKGAYTLDDAYVLHNVCVFFQNIPENELLVPGVVTEKDTSKDLDVLSEPVPLRATKPVVV